MHMISWVCHIGREDNRTSRKVIREDTRHPCIYERSPTSPIVQIVQIPQNYHRYHFTHL